MNVKQVLVELEKQLAEALAKLEDARNAEFASLEGKTAKEANDSIHTIIDAVSGVFCAVEVDGYRLPDFLYTVKFYDDADEVTLTLKSKLKFPLKVKLERDIKLDKYVIRQVGDAVYDICSRILKLSIVMDRVEEINTELAKIYEENGVGAKFFFEVTDKSSEIARIDNEEVIFKADVDAVLDLHRCPILLRANEGNEYDTFIYEEFVGKLVNALSVDCTTVQIIKSHISLIKDIAGMSTKKRAKKLIREAYHKNAKYLGKQKSGIGYFDETLSINGEDVDVFGLVEKAEDGALSVVLNPFDVKTNMSVDIDLIEEVKKIME